MTPRLEHMTELALILAIPDMCVGKIKKSRLKAIYKRLQKAVIKEISKKALLSNAEKARIHTRICNFANATGWEKQEVDVAILISFVLAIIEESRHDYPKRIIDCLNDAHSWVTRDKIEPELMASAEKSVLLWRNACTHTRN